MFSPHPNIDTRSPPRRYIGKQLGANPPHLFAIAEDSYANLRLHNRDQSILISGESGYENINPLLLLFSFATDQEKQRPPSWLCNILLPWRERCVKYFLIIIPIKSNLQINQKETNEDSVEVMILESSPILEVWELKL